ncbi:hypothetical protein CERSUDRAFT_100862 [Gelatoporia subvermispora B]|uniref:Uncharacterized protein n=1 Tax=Ceriporiopsis subvermispora (strain B) TaxID=914234 RepID=M2QWS4_CERS8|nr:hypothetical protein CERSUDRAFT_100862 [Gelatoporia subvermispora B]
MDRPPGLAEITTRIRIQTFESLLQSPGTGRWTIDARTVKPAFSQLTATPHDLPSPSPPRSTARQTAKCWLESRGTGAVTLTALTSAVGAAKSKLRGGIMAIDRLSRIRPDDREFVHPDVERADASANERGVVGLALIYPGLGHSAMITQAFIMTDTMLIVGASCLVSPSPALKGPDNGILSDSAEAKRMSFEIAVAEQAITEGSAGAEPLFIVKHQQLVLTRKRAAWLRRSMKDEKQRISKGGEEAAMRETTMPIKDDAIGLLYAEEVKTAMTGMSSEHWRTPGCSLLVLTPARTMQRLMGISAHPL